MLGVKFTGSSMGIDCFANCGTEFLKAVSQVITNRNPVFLMNF